MKFRPEPLEVLENVKTAPGHYRMRLASPRIARTARPGQFIQITVSEHQDPLLPRPFSFLRTGPGWFDILYQVVGRGTEILAAKKKGDLLTVLGPLGRGWDLARSAASTPTTHVLVGGGVGIPPLFHWAKTLLAQKIPASRIRIFLGGRNRALLHCLSDFTRLGLKPICATDDASYGHGGLITQPLGVYLEMIAAAAKEARSARGEFSRRPPRTVRAAARASLAAAAARVQIYTCGPTPMLKAVSKLAAQYSVPTQVSVEEPMPCGFGVCLGCAIKVSDGNGGHRFALSCTEGPVFDACKVMWS